ncbi:MAG: ATP-binding protein [Anaerolineaceae bacterium]
MRCRKCGVKAAINLPEHRLALCKAHLLDWIPEQTERFIQKYDMFTHEDRILVAVSGGKDSLALWDVLWRLGYNADGLYINLGIDGGVEYSARSLRCARQFADARSLNLMVSDIPAERGVTIPELAMRSVRGKERPCAVCGIVKRHIMNQMTTESGYTVIATGHNLDDEAAVLFGNTLVWDGEQIVRQSPVLPAKPGMARKVKPFCRFYERETAAYTLMRGIEYEYDECPHALGNRTNEIKTQLNQMEANKPGVKLTFYLSFLQAKENGLFQPQSTTAVDLHPCPTCGQPSVHEGNCTFCRLFENK